MKMMKSQGIRKYQFVNDMHKKMGQTMEKYFPCCKIGRSKNFIFKVYQMDVKFSFLNGILEEEVYIEQPKEFFDVNNKNMVCRLHKDLYMV